MHKVLENSAPDLLNLKAYRDRAAENLSRLGLPHAKSEAFSYVRVSDFLPFLPLSGSNSPNPAEIGKAEHLPPPVLPSKDEILRHIVPEAMENHIVIVDGQFVPELSRTDSGLRIMPLEAYLEQGNPEQSRLLHAVVAEDDYAAGLASSLAPFPLAIVVPAKEENVSKPLQILYYASPAHAARLDIHTVFFLGKLSESRIIVKFASSDLASESNPDAKNSRERRQMINVSQRFFLEEAALLRYSQFQAENEDRIHFSKAEIFLARNSRFQGVAASIGTLLTRHAYAIRLEGEGSEAEIKAAAVLGGARQVHNHLQVHHLVPHCTSRQHLKTVADNQSKASFDGTIFVAKDAQLTNATQLVNNLMLSDEARADSKPRLMIQADDVKCSHGATVGKLDPAQQFYLQSRGLPPEQARTLMTVAFVGEIIGQMDSEGLRRHLQKSMLEPLLQNLEKERRHGD